MYTFKNWISNIPKRSALVVLMAFLLPSIVLGFVVSKQASQLKNQGRTLVYDKNRETLCFKLVYDYQSKNPDQTTGIRLYNRKNDLCVYEEMRSFDGGSHLIYRLIDLFTNKDLAIWDNIDSNLKIGSENYFDLKDYYLKTRNDAYDPLTILKENLGLAPTGNDSNSSTPNIYSDLIPKTETSNSSNPGKIATPKPAVTPEQSELLEQSKVKEINAQLQTEAQVSQRLKSASVDPRCEGRTMTGQVTFRPAYNNKSQLIQYSSGDGATFTCNIVYR
ncbi:MAG: hypothetical protein JWM20_601 [Patescibacteria group bacterium]|nr:hypothetical protein [Patescibacteria group bacterium]